MGERTTRDWKYMIQQMSEGVWYVIGRPTTKSKMYGLESSARSHMLKVRHRTEDDGSIVVEAQLP